MAPAIIGANAPCPKESLNTQHWMDLCCADAMTPIELFAVAPPAVADYVRERLACVDAGMGTEEDARLVYAYVLGGIQ